MRTLLSMLFLFNVFSDCYADVSYNGMLTWSKNKIIQEAKSEYSASELDTLLNNFPQITNTSCGSLTLTFIQNSPECGAINCGYFVFMRNAENDYQFLQELQFAAQRLICFKKNSKRYLITSVHATNASSKFTLYKVKGSELIKINSIDINYSKKSANDFAESIWQADILENNLLTGFKK
jgi:hypothetical protein